MIGMVYTIVANGKLKHVACQRTCNLQTMFLFVDKNQFVTVLAIHCHKLKIVAK
jgi:hypothetical protein